MKIILKIKEGGHSLPVNKSQTRKDTFANTKVVAIIVIFTVGSWGRFNRLIVLVIQKSRVKVATCLIEFFFLPLCNST